MLVPSQENLIKLILIKDIITRVQQLQPRQPPRPVLPVGICGGCRINSLPRILNRIFILFKKIQLAASASEATAEITRGCRSLNLSLQPSGLIANIYTQILIRQTHLFHQRQQLPSRKHPKPELLNVITHHDLTLSVSAKCLHTCVCA